MLSADLYEQRVLRGNMNTLDLILDNGIIAIARGIYGENQAKHWQQADYFQP